MGHRYAVWGAGMQGTAAAYDLALRGDASEVRILDLGLGEASAAADHVNRLAGRPVCTPGVIETSDPSQVATALEGMHACLSAVPYHLNPALTQAAIDAKVHFCDLGGNQACVQKQLALDDAAKDAGVSVVPDCGVAPGAANLLATFGIEQFDRPISAQIRCGGLPQDRTQPLGYTKVFSLEGLTNEYLGEAVVLRKGKVALVPTLSDVETLELPKPLGFVEAAVTSGGTSTGPYTYEDRLQSYEYRTIRYPGHWEKIKLFRDLGFLSDDARVIQGQEVVPRKLFESIMTEVWSRTKQPDLLVLVVDVEGEKDGKNLRHRSYVLDYYNEETGFSAMQRTTAFSAAIASAAQAQGHLSPGVLPMERAIQPKLFVQELLRRQISVETSLSAI